MVNSSQLTAYSSQLIADSFYLLTGFLPTVIDPSRSFRMTINISLIMTPCRPVSFWTVARMPCGKNGKRNDETEWRIYVSDDVLPLFLITVIDPSHSFRMTSFVLHHYDASRSPLLVTSFPPIVILNRGKHAVWEKQETERWNNVKNLLCWWRLTAFPHHGNRSFTFVQDDV